MRTALLALIVAVLPANVFGQAVLAGKWSTTAAAPAPAGTARGGENQGVRRDTTQMPERTVDPKTGRATMVNPLDPTGRSRLIEVDPAAVTSTPPPVLLELTVAGNRVTGTVTETAKPGALVIEEGVLTGKVFTFKTRRERSQGLEALVWKGELIDAETIILVPTLVRNEQKSGRGVNPIRGGAPSRSEGPGLAGAPKAGPPEEVKTAGGLVLRRAK
jgi:hypothetical protein